MNIQDRITKFTDLENDDSLSAYNGHTAQQSHNVYQIFYDFIQEIKPKQILEIGTALGGFTEFLFLICKELNLDTKILSYDIDRRPWYSEMVVLCDGGWKIGEFNVLLNYIKSGDFILAHDFSTTREVYENEIKNKIWNWCEITEDDIKDAVDKHNLKSYNQELFSQAVWVCKYK